MPITVPAHQAVVLPFKLRWGNAVDGTALFVGAAAADLAYGLGPRLGAHSHWGLGLSEPGAGQLGLAWALGYTLTVVWLLRSGAATVVFRSLPDGGPWRIHSYAALGSSGRRPRLWVTLFSALAGFWSHVFLDSFTHNGRPVARLLGLDQPVMSLSSALGGPITYANVLQGLGHTVGSAIGIWLLWLVGHRKLMERWHGADAVAAARATSLPSWVPPVFWAGVLTGIVLVSALQPVLWGGPGVLRVHIFSIIAGAGISMPIMGWVLAWAVKFGKDQTEPARGSIGHSNFTGQ